MRMPRVSIAGAMLWVVASAVAVAALNRPSPLWAGLLVAVTLGALTYALIGVLHARGPSRAYWSGFAVAGWMAFAVHYAPWFREHVTPMLGTTALSDMTYHLLRGAKGDADPGINPVLSPLAMHTVYFAGNNGVQPMPGVAPPVIDPSAAGDLPPATSPSTTPAPSAAPAQYVYTFFMPRSSPWSWWSTPKSPETSVVPMTPVPMEAHYIFISIFTLIAAILGGHAARRFAANDATPDAPH